MDTTREAAKETRYSENMVKKRNSDHMEEECNQETEYSVKRTIHPFRNIVIYIKERIKLSMGRRDIDSPKTRKIVTFPYEKPYLYLCSKVNEPN